MTASATTPADGPGAAVGRAALFAALAALSAGLLVIGVVNPWSLVWIDRLLGHPLWILSLAFVLAWMAVVRTRWWSWVKLLVVISGTLAYLFAMIAGLLLGISGNGSAGVIPAPNGRPYEALTRDEVAAIDPIWSVSIRQTSGLLAREYYVGCVNGDDPANTLTSVHWAGPDQLILATADGDQVAVNVSSEGHPMVASDPGVLGCPGDE